MTEGTGQQRHGILLGNGAARDVRGRMVAHVSTNAGCTQGATPHPGAATAASGHNTHMDIILNGQSLPLPDQTTLAALLRSEEHTSELQSLMRSSYAVFCLKKNKKT